MHILSKEVIQKIVQNIDLVPLIEKGFIAYSNGKTIVPPVGELTFKNPPGDVHIKYGYIVNESYYIIKRNHTVDKRVDTLIKLVNKFNTEDKASICQ